MIIEIDLKLEQHQTLSTGGSEDLPLLYHDICINLDEYIRLLFSRCSSCFGRYESLNFYGFHEFVIAVAFLRKSFDYHF